MLNAAKIFAPTKVFSNLADNTSVNCDFLWALQHSKMVKDAYEQHNVIIHSWIQL
jgi:hypothetical protein